MKVVVLGLTFVSVLAFKLVISVEGDGSGLNVHFDGKEVNVLSKAESTGLNISDEIDVDIFDTEGKNRNVSEIAGNESEHKLFRLPRSLRPIHYKLEVLHILDELELESGPENVSSGHGGYHSTDHEHFRRFTSPGKVWVDIQVLEPTRNVTLHADDLKIGLIEVKNLLTNDPVKISQVERDNETQFLILNLHTDLDIGTYQVYIEFVSRIADDRLNGLYLDYYVNPATKQKRFLATTLFAPNHARKAFPCFDEPELRATFDIKIGRLEKNYKSLSNMQLVSTNPIPGMTGWVWDEFERTPSMSTYIVAMITCDFKAQESFYTNRNFTNNTIKAFAPNYLLNYSNSTGTSTDYSLQIIGEIIPFFEDYFDSEFPLKKLSAISLPHFYFSAMENWGMMTFKDPVLINIQNVTTESERNRISRVLIHELSHQWFGNLVGIKFWTYVWLKEAFSTYYSYLGMEVTHPELNPWVHFTTDSLQVALKYDESLDTHPLENEPKTAGGIGDVYTRIPYDKGASILRMTSGFMTSKVFLEGIKLYIQRMKYKAATQDDLFQALQDTDDGGSMLLSQNLESSVTIKNILDTWTKQDGFPIVRVKVEGERNILQLSQEKFVNPLVLEIKKLENTTEPNSTKGNASWWIPITLRPKISEHGLTEGNDPDPQYTDVWIPENESEIFVDYKFTNELFLVNPDAIGYYRVLYEDPEVMNRIQEQLVRNHSVLSPVSRSQLLDDYFAFAFAQYVPLQTTLNLTKYLSKETELVVWTTVLTNLKTPHDLLKSSEFFPAFRDYVIQLLIPAWQSSVIEPPDDVDDLTEKTRLRSLMFKYICLFEPKRCAEIAGNFYQTWVKNPSINPIPTDYQETMYCAIVSTASSQTLNETWNFFASFYNSEYFSVQKSRYLKALSCVTNTNRLEELLSWTTDSGVDLHDVDKVQIIKFVAENPLGKNLVLKYLDNNFKSLYKNVSAANPVSEGFNSLVPYLNSKEELKSLEQFVLKYSEVLGGKKKSFEKQFRKVKLNILWMETFAIEIKSWMEMQTNVLEYDVQQSYCFFGSSPVIWNSKSHRYYSTEKSNRRLRRSGIILFIAIILAGLISLEKYLENDMNLFNISLVYIFATLLGNIGLSVFINYPDELGNACNGLYHFAITFQRTWIRNYIPEENKYNKYLDNLLKIIIVNLNLGLVCILSHYCMFPSSIYFFTLFPESLQVYVPLYLGCGVCVMYFISTIWHVLILLASMVGTYYLFIIPLLVRELRSNRSDWTTIGALRKPNNLVLVYRTLEILHKYFTGVFGNAIVPFQTVISQCILAINYTLITQGNSLETVTLILLVIFTLSFQSAWFFVLHFAGLLHAEGVATLRSWEHFKFGNKLDSKYIARFRKSCRPLRIGKEGYYVIRKITVLEFFRAIVIGTFRTLLTLENVSISKDNSYILITN